MNPGRGNGSVIDEVNPTNPLANLLSQESDPVLGRGISARLRRANFSTDPKQIHYEVRDPNLLMLKQDTLMCHKSLRKFSKQHKLLVLKE